MTKKIFFAVGIICTFLMCVRCAPVVEATYTPSEEFLPAYNALMDAEAEANYTYQVDALNNVIKVQSKPGDSEEYYDIEETVRILNGLELAQSQSEDFYSYLEYMAKQDYSMIPREVISAKAQLLPIMQEMLMLERENEELTGLTAVFKSLGTGIYELAKESGVPESGSGMLGMLSSMSSPLSMVLGKTIGEYKDAAFVHYEELQKLKEENKKTIDILRAKYLAYLNNFTPIYMKYINEWERLCIDKDKAYLAVYSNRYLDCYQTTSEILEKYPANREAMLLKALASINIAKSMTASPSGDTVTLTAGNDSGNERYRFVVDAQTTLENYINLYPGKAAPALVLMGELEQLNGNSERAISYFDQAAIEYPKQAAELKDMLNSYYIRSYLNATPEGSYLMRLYSSTMEGYGWFSPNFHKALYWESVGENAKAANEIYNHFFRRDNQGLYDCLLTDMEFCEENLYKTFKLQFMESSAINVSVEKDANMLSKNSVKITLTNNSDLKLENVRLFVCFHLKDMYTSEYVVYPCETINIFAPKATRSWSTADYQIENIVRVRAIMMTDDRVCWVDDVNCKQSDAMRNYYQLQGNVTKSLNLFDDYGLSELEIFKQLKQNVSGLLVSADSKMKGMLKNVVGAAEARVLNVELPRAVCLLDPVFSIGELNKNITPSLQTLEGSKMRLEFKVEGGAAKEPLYMYSNFINLKIDYEIDDNGKLNVKDVIEI